MPSDIQSYQTISLNSLYAKGTSSNFRFALPGNLIEMPPKRKVKVGVLQATFPSVYTNVNALNNRLYVSESSTTGPDLFFLNFTIPVGTYNAAQLLTALNVALNAASAANGAGLTYACTQAASVITFVTSTADYDVSLLLDSRNFTAETLLGLDPTVDNPVFSLGDNYTAPFTVNLVNFFGPQEIHIRCSDFISRCYESRAGSVTSILAICQNNVATEDLNMTFSTPIPNILMETSYNTTSMTFQITNAEGEELTGLAGPVTMLLGLYHYDSE